MLMCSFPSCAHSHPLPFPCLNPLLLTIYPNNYLLHIHVTALKRIISYTSCWCHFCFEFTFWFICFTNTCLYSNLLFPMKSNWCVVFLLSTPTREILLLTKLLWYFVHPLVFVLIILLAVISIVVWLPKMEGSVRADCTVFICFFVPQQLVALLDCLLCSR